MVGIPPPSSSRIRPSLLLAGATSPRSRSPVQFSRGDVPLESVTLRGSPEKPICEQRGNADTTKNDDLGEHDGHEKSTHVKVCVRLRPLLPGDVPSGGAGVASTPAPVSREGPSTGRDRGFARGTTSSHRRTTPGGAGTVRRHASGLVTPSSRSAPSGDPSWIARGRARVVQAPHTAVATAHRDPERLADYSFDRVYAPGEATGQLYEESVREVASAVVAGYHGSVFAYGQTNSGKTHTMSGSWSEAGVVRLAVKDIFDRIRSQHSSNSSPPREYLVRVSYLEIYNEQIYDLLAPSGTSSKFKASLQHHHLPPSTSVRIFESRTEGVVVRGLREEIVTCAADVFALLEGGDARRKVGSTKMNLTSSRSHAVFRLVLESHGGGSRNACSGGAGRVSPSNSPVTSDTDSSVATGPGSVSTQQSFPAKGPVRISSLSLVDLAGSESAKATGSTGVRQKEGQYINKSLLTLAHVVKKLSDMSSKSKKPGSLETPPNEHIPYRDSKLTRLLQPSLGGNARVCIICCVSPAIANLEESHNTLKFAVRAKKIKQHAKITEVADEKTLLRSYREEIEELKRQLKDAKKVVAEANDGQRRAEIEAQSTSQMQRTLAAIGSSSLDDEEDQDDENVLVSAIANLESLILKAGAGGTSTQHLNSGGTIARGVGAGDQAPMPNRALDAALMGAKEESGPGILTADNRQQLLEPMLLSPARMSASSLDYSPLASTPKIPTQCSRGGTDDQNVLEELHRIQGMLGTIMKQKKRKGGGGTGDRAGFKSPEQDEEVERLREALVVSTMRKADSLFLQSQLNMKESLLREVTVLLEALEKRQLGLENENKQLNEDLVEATIMIEESAAANKLLETRLAERDLQLAEKKYSMVVPAPIDSTISCSLYPPPPSTHGNLAVTLELPSLPVEKHQLS